MSTSADHTPDVSVILVSFNTRELTVQAIEALHRSIVREGFVVEVIVVDNASSDGSADAVAARFPEVRLIRSETNLGFGRGNNLGASRARGRVLLLLNTDTVTHSGAVETLLDRIDGEQKVGVAGPYLINPDGTFQESRYSFPTVWSTFCTMFWLDVVFRRFRFFAGGRLLHADPEEEGDVDVINGAALMIRRDLYELLGGFDPAFFMYYEEFDLCHRVRDAGYRVRYVPSARVEHLVRGSSQARPWWFYRVLRVSRAIYARKHMGRFQALALAAIYHVAYALRIVVYPLVGLFRRRFWIIARNMLLSYTSGARSPLDTQRSPAR